MSTKKTNQTVAKIAGVTFLAAFYLNSFAATNTFKIKLPVEKKYPIVLCDTTAPNERGIVKPTRGSGEGIVKPTRGSGEGIVKPTRGSGEGIVKPTRGRTDGIVKPTRGSKSSIKKRKHRRAAVKKVVTPEPTN